MAHAWNPRKAVIVGAGGHNQFAAGLALVLISAAILGNQRSVMTVSDVLKGQYGLSGAALGIPCIVSQKSVERILAL
jgi:L-lactate dehydrogenase